MSVLKVVLCSYSYGLGNGIAHVDADLIHGIPGSRFAVIPFVLRPDFPSGRSQTRDGATHISLLDAYTVLCEQLQDAHILHVNGALDPVAANAAPMTKAPLRVRMYSPILGGRSGMMRSDTGMPSRRGRPAANDYYRCLPASQREAREAALCIR